VVLAAFAAGCVVGVLAMLPGWWRQRRAARMPSAAKPGSPSSAANPSASPAAPPHELL
jgi:lipopolysaccharide assembly protein A